MRTILSLSLLVPLLALTAAAADHERETNGRCCYGNPCAPTCAVMPQAACLALGGSWVPGLTCAAPCPLPPTGDVCCNAYVLSVPGTTNFSTATFSNNYDVACPFGSTAKDAVYRYTPAANQLVSFDLCQSGFDTKLSLYQDVCTGTPLSCSDDVTSCGSDSRKSRITCQQLLAGHTYYVVIDGHGTASGTYRLISSLCTPCVVPCPAGAVAEGEPPCGDGYVDAFDGGCASSPAAFKTLSAGQTVCGTSGTFTTAGQTQRDTDVYQVLLTAPGTLRWQVRAEFPLQIGILSGDCPSPAVLTTASAAICTLLTVSYNAVPGLYSLSVSPQADAVVPCGADYAGTVTTTPWTPPPGRCCYGPEPWAPQCALNAEYECHALGGNWTADSTCAAPCEPYLCAQPAPGTYCQLAGGPVPDGPARMAAFTTTVTRPYHITDVNVCLNLSHTWDSDLCLWLVSPAGTVDTLCLHRGHDGDHFYGTLFDDEAGTPIAFGVAPFTGGFVPEEPLSVFDGENAAGTWTLYVRDDASPDAGALNWFCVLFEWDYQLAVDLASFTAEGAAGEVRLAWQTRAEAETDFYELLRDGEPLAQIDAVNRPTGASYHYTDASVSNGETYHYLLRAVNFAGARSDLRRVEATPQAAAGVITAYALRQNYPNPFNLATEIPIELPEGGAATLTVYNLMGQMVAVPLSSWLAAGSHTVRFWGTDLPSGIYLCRLSVNGFHAERKLLLLK